jgi:hypothetical protein
MNITWRKTPYDRPQWRSYENIADDGLYTEMIYQPMVEHESVLQ